MLANLPIYHDAELTQSLLKDASEYATNMTACNFKNNLIASICQVYGKAIF